MSKVLNNLLCTAGIFALAFLWTYYSLKSVTWAVALALIISLCSAYLIYRLQNKIGQVQNTKLQNKKAAAKLYDYLKYNDNNAEIFAQLYRYYNYQVSILDYDNFVASKEGVTTLVTLHYANDVLTTNDVAQAIVSAKRNKADKLCAYASKIDASVRKTAIQHFDVTFVDVANAYILLEQSDKLPSLPQIKPTKNSFIAKYAFCRKRFGWYFGSCVFMTVISVIAYFPYYLLGWATVMLFLALYSLLNTRYNAKQTDVKLD